ncbi:MAG TPA: S-adenosylmethionine:tRNA ribosyltransferase-isomerase [Jiangellaceae bacterium]
MNASPAVLSFKISPDQAATSPAEHRGLRRDGVRLLVARPAVVEHRRFEDLPDILEPGDLLVINTSGTLPAAVDAAGRTGPVHVSTALDDGGWVIELRRGDGRGPDHGLRAGEHLELAGGVRLEVLEPYPRAGLRSARLWRARPSRAVDLVTYLRRYGRPIRYGYLDDKYPITAYQTVYATTPGSAEMPSAGRPFSETLLVRLIARGVTVAPIVLHAGVSSPEVHEPPFPERYDVPAATARLVDSALAAGNRVIAVGTTVVRALETCATPDGVVRPGRGWTDLVLSPDRPARVVNGLISGLHEPGASHLKLLEAVVGPDLVRSAYQAAVDHGYLWHEFGDSTVFLPDRRSAS